MLPSPPRGVPRAVLGGWSLAAIATIQSGSALTVAETNSDNVFGISEDRAELSGLCKKSQTVRGGAVDSKVRQSIANQDAARQNLESARRGAQLLAQISFAGVTNGVAQVKALDQALKLAKDSATEQGIDPRALYSMACICAIASRDVPHREPYAAEAYDAATIAIKAIEETAKKGKVSREDVATAVRKAKLSGITGDIAFDAKGDRVKAQYFVLTVVSDDPAKWGDNKIVKQLTIAPPAAKK